MNGNLNTVTLPACEEGYRRLQKLLAQHRESATKKPNFEALDKLITVLVNNMEDHSADIVPRSAKWLFTTAGVDDCVFDRNFSDVEGTILILKGVLVNGIDNYVVRLLGVGSYTTALTRLFEYLSASSADAKYNSVRLRFAVLRFSNDFWEIALHSLYPFVVKNWEEFDFATREYIFTQFVSGFRSVLKYWMRHDFSTDYIDRCFRLLNIMTGLSRQDVQAIQSVFSK